MHIIFQAACPMLKNLYNVDVFRMKQGDKGLHSMNQSSDPVTYLGTNCTSNQTNISPNFGGGKSSKSKTNIKQDNLLWNVM